VTERGYVNGDLARSWDAPNVEGRRYLLMKPASEEEVYLRFVQSPTTDGYEPLRTHGWNATEILVEDPDKLAGQLADSPFRIIGPPRPLTMNPKVRAMQVIGPANELLYLTRIPAGGSLFDLGSAKTFVDRTFIVVVGGPSISAIQAFYRDVLRLPVTAANPAVVNVVNDANKLPQDTAIPLAIARLPKNFLVELDEYPSVTRPRPQRNGDLPPGMAIVSFVTQLPAEAKLDWLREPVTRPEAPYAGRRAGLVRGAAGELIELVLAP
jgi:hypothetical protein